MRRIGARQELRGTWLDPELESRKVTSAPWSRIFRYARPYAGRIILFLVFNAAAATVGALPPLIFRAIIDDAIGAGDRGLLNTLALAALAVAILHPLATLIGGWFGMQTAVTIVYDLRVALFRKIQRMPMAFFTKSQPGALLTRISQDVSGAQSVFTGSLSNVVSTVLTLVITLAIMFVLDWRLTLLSLGLAPLFFAPSRWVGRKLKRVTREGYHVHAGMNSLMTERFNAAGAMLVKLFGDYGREVESFSEQAEDLSRVYFRQWFLQSGFGFFLGVVASVGLAAVYWVGGIFVFTGAVSLGTLVAFATYTMQLYGPMRTLPTLRVSLMQSVVSFERVFEVLDMPQLVEDRPGTVRLVSAQGHLEFDQVWFRYPAADEVTIASLRLEDDQEPQVDSILRDVSFVVEPGTMTALVGPSGAGKTTIAMLAARLYDVSTGTVRFDGTDIRDIRQDSFASNIAVVSQDPHLFQDTIRANLLYAQPDATEDEVVEACRHAQIHDLVASLPQGYDTMVGQRGYRMSGGEKQRLALARVFLKDPVLVILDEATAHLDSTSERLIQRALTEMLTGRSSIVIAHRLSTIMQADQILVVQRGRIVEVGQHMDLVMAGGIYQTLYETQFAEARS